jgi:uncharacterized delta-60 repeat protein
MRRRLLAITGLLVLLAGPVAATPGALDTSFSGNGIQTIFAGGSTAQAVAIDPHGRILVAGSTIGANENVAIARLRPGGALDGSFSGDGRVRIDLGADEGAMDIASTPDGTIVVVGQRTTRRGAAWFVIRLRSGGTRDTSFGGDGVVFTDFGRRFERANAVAIQPDGRIVAGGSVSDGTRESWSFARYLSGGALDSSFGGDGRVTMSLSTSGEQVQDVVVRSERIFAAGYAESGSLPVFAVAKLRLDGGRADWGLVRLHPGGARDGSFGGDGVVTTAFTPGYELASSVAMQADGRILAAGKARGSSGTDDLAVVRYRADGGLNLSFSGNGKACSTPTARTTPRGTSWSTTGGSSSWATRCVTSSLG